MGLRDERFSRYYGIVWLGVIEALTTSKQGRTIRTQVDMGNSGLRLLRQ